jgi:serine/threonine-protein kinase
VEQQLQAASRPASDRDDTQAGPETALGVILGTVGYMSPEQAAGQPATPQSDQFSLGAIMYEMATGQRAFSRPTSVQTLTAILESEPTPIQEVNPAFPPSARWIVERCLAKRPENRYASTADLARDLRDVRDRFREVTTGIRTSAIRRWAANPRVRRRGLIGATVLLALFGLFAVPAINEFVRSAIGFYRLPDEKRLAVLPLECRGGTEADRDACAGMLEYIVGKLGEQDRFQSRGGLAVVPALDIRQAGRVTIDAARNALGASLAVSVTATRAAGRVDYVVTVIDTAAHKQVRSAEGSLVEGEGPLAERVVREIVDLLDLDLTAEAQAALAAGGTSSAEAASLYAQGLQAVPVQAGRSALDRQDQERSLEEAIELFTRAVEIDPKYAYAHASLGEAYFRLFRLNRNLEYFKLAEAHCRRALQIDDLVGQAWQTLGNIHTEVGQAREALEELEKARARLPRSPEVLRDIAGAYTRLGRQDEAEAQYKKAIAARPDAWSIYWYYGGFLYRANRYEEAENAFRQALLRVPDNARIHASLGGALLARGRVEEALRTLERSLELQPTATAASNLGTLLYQRGDFPAAASAYEHATELSPRDYRMWRNLAAGYDKAPGRRDQAAAAYRKALALAEQERELDPTDGRVVIEMADCAAMLGDKPRALTLTAEALALSPRNSELQYMAADIYETLGDRTRALQCLERALRAGYQRTLLETSPSFASLRADPRYKTLIASSPAAPARVP